MVRKQQKFVSHDISKIVHNLLDIDECNTDLNDCHKTHGICTNTAGNFKCACRDGTLGDGRICSKPCASMYNTYPDYLADKNAFNVGQFNVKSLTDFDTVIPQGIPDPTNWKPEESLVKTISYVKMKAGCRLEGFAKKDFQLQIGAWRGSLNLENRHQMDQN